MSVALSGVSMRSLYWSVTFVLMAAVLLSLEACCNNLCQMARQAGDGEVGGGEDAVTIDMPFDMGYVSQCVQGAGGSYSHRYTSTRYDADFDTPNAIDDLVFAPVGGTAYVHDDDRESGFGVHINIDMGDGTYIILGHLEEVFVDNGSEVAAGQLLGFEGTTGASTGDHVHIGRHDGDATEDGTYGTSIEGLKLSVDDITASREGVVSTSDLTCDLSSGHRYASQLATPRWHPNGTLVKKPDSSTVYLLEDGIMRPFVDETSFTSRGYDFGNVALVSEEELACYQNGESINGEASRSSSSAVFHDGSLVSEVSSSAVYVIADGIAMPIETWDVYLLMGFEDRVVTEVDNGTVASSVEVVGDCADDVYCITKSDIVTCGGPSGEEVMQTESDDEESSTSSEDSGVAATTDGLSVTWSTATGAAASRITLSGEYTHNSGWSEGWQTLGESRGLSYFSYDVVDAQPGDALRFSVEFVEGSATSWSCIAPFPPGTVQGKVSATYRGNAVSVAAVDDPSSNGCGLFVTVPE